MVAKCGYITIVKKNLILCKTSVFGARFYQMKKMKIVYFVIIFSFFFKEICHISKKSFRHISTLMFSSIFMTCPNNFQKLVIKNAKEGALNGIRVAI
jgi:hypothetical protein